MNMSKNANSKFQLSLGLILGFFFCITSFATKPKLPKEEYTKHSYILELHSHLSEGLSLETATEIMERVSKVYPKARYEILWTDSLRANAYNFMGILIFTTKAFVELPMMTEDAFTLTLLHEVGHSLGGPPTYPNGGSCEDVADAWSVADGLMQVWGIPKTKKEKIEFYKRAESAIYTKASYLEYFETGAEEVLNKLNLIEYSNQTNETQKSCGHQSSEHRKQNMLKALSERLDLVIRK